MTRPQIALIAAGSLITIFIVLILFGVIPGLRPDPKTQPPPPPVAIINMWGFEQDSLGWYKVIADYNTSHPETRIVYTVVSELNYESKLIDNLAAGTGPDIFVLQNSWLPKFRNKIVPAPADLISPARVSEIFPPVVSDDFVVGGQIWGLPVSIDTLALVYNRSIFDSKQLVLPPATWDEVKNLVPRIKEVSSGTISKSAIALGGGESSVRNAADILSTMLLQLKNNIIDPFTRSAVISNATGLQGLNLYTSFSDSSNPAYTWDLRQGDNSMNSFVSGKTAMVLVYKRQINEIMSRNPLLKLVVAPMPQLDPNNPISLGNYWGLVVANQSKNQAIAWDFINSVTTTTNTGKTYVDSSGFPPALRELIPAYISDPLMKVFASQALAAKSVPFIQYPPVLEALNNMIESTLINRFSAAANLKAAADRINAIIQ